MKRENTVRTNDLELRRKRNVEMLIAGITLKTTKSEIESGTAMVANSVREEGVVCALSAKNQSRDSGSQPSA